MEIFVKIVKGFQPWTIFAKGSILDDLRGSEHSSELPASGQ